MNTESKYQLLSIELGFKMLKNLMISREINAYLARVRYDLEMNDLFIPQEIDDVLDYALDLAGHKFILPEKENPIEEATQKLLSNPCLDNLVEFLFDTYMILPRIDESNDDHNIIGMVKYYARFRTNGREYFNSAYAELKKLIAKHRDTVKWIKTMLQYDEKCCQHVQVPVFEVAGKRINGAEVRRDKVHHANKKQA